MNRSFVLVLGAVGLCVLLGAAVSRSVVADKTAPPTAAASGMYFKFVRAEYIDLAGNHPHSDTFCEVVNASAEPVTLLDVYVLGSGGASDVLAVSSMFNGTSLPPMGRIRFPVTNAFPFPGLVPQTSVGNFGVANVVVGWSGGTIASVVLTSNVVRVSNGSQDDRTEVHYVGHPIGL